MRTIAFLSLWHIFQIPEIRRKYSIFFSFHRERYVLYEIIKFSISKRAECLKKAFVGKGPRGEPVAQGHTGTFRFVEPSLIFLPSLFLFFLNRFKNLLRFDPSDRRKKKWRKRINFYLLSYQSPLSLSRLSSSSRLSFFLSFFCHFRMREQT